MYFENIVKNINSLPPLPESVQEIERVFNSGDIEIKNIVKIIESDPILTADILALCNSPLFSFSKTISSIAQATTLLGAINIRSFALSSAMKSTFKINLDAYGINSAKFADISNMQSKLMFQWYMGIDIQKSSILTPLMFLIEMGKLLLGDELAKSEYCEAFKDEIKNTNTPIDELEDIYTGFSTYKIDKLLFEHWNFDQMFIDIMDHSINSNKDLEHLDEYAKAIKVVHSAINIRGILSDENIKNSLELAKNYGFDEEKYKKVLLRLKDKYIF